VKMCFQGLSIFISIVAEELEHITMLLYPLCLLYSNPSQIPFNLQGYMHEL
jgi:hypothetical protein